MKEHVFGDERPFAQCHAPTLVQLFNNRYLAAWFAGTREKHPDTGIWGAARSNDHWSLPVRLAKVDERPHWNPVLQAAPDGAVRLYFKVGNSVPEWETWLTVSLDEGRTWSRPAQLVPGDRGGRGPVKNKILVLADGAWLAPASLEGGVEGVFVDRSEDDGGTWHRGALVPLDASLPAGTRAIQPALWASAPGAVHLLARTSTGFIGRSDSRDGGRTWSPLKNTALPNNNSGLDLAAFGDGLLVLACNPVAGDPARRGVGQRSPLSLLASRDNGASWPGRLDIETGPGEYSYPSIIATATGPALVYTWRRERIGFLLVGHDHPDLNR